MKTFGLFRNASRPGAPREPADDPPADGDPGGIRRRTGP